MSTSAMQQINAAFGRRRQQQRQLINTE